jgi:hypothetical protein
MSGASTQRIAQASHPQTKETLEAVGKGVKLFLSQEQKPVCPSWAHIPRTYSFNPLSFCLPLMLGTPKYPQGLTFKFYLGFNNFGGHLSAFGRFEVRRFFTRSFASGPCLAPKSVGEQ